MKRNAPRQNLTELIANRLRDIVYGGEVAGDAFLPTERELARIHQVSRVTVRRSLSQLVSEGLLESVPTQGYRPILSRKTARFSKRIAYVAAQVEPENWDASHAGILGAFQRVLVPHGVAVLALGIRNREPETVFRELKQAQVMGVVLDASEENVQSAALRSGVPTVVVNALGTRPELDTIIQDNQEGTRLSVEYLLSRGHKRLGWVGPTRGFAHWSERFSGAREALWNAHLEFKDIDILQPRHSDDREEAAALVRARMQQPNPPDAFVCPWQSMVLGAAEGIRELKKPPELCGWCNEREYRERFAPEFLGGLVPAMVVWRPEEMVELARERLAYRQLHPQTFSCRLNVRVRLFEPQKAEEVLRVATRLTREGLQNLESNIQEPQKP